MKREIHSGLENIGDKNKFERVILEYERRIRAIAKRVVEKNKIGNIFSLEEIIQAGRIGLLDAIRKYDEKKRNGGTFSTFAGIKIKGAMMDYIRKNGYMSRDDIRKMNLLKGVQKMLLQKLKREPTLREVAEELKMSEKEVENIRGIFNRLNAQSLYFENGNNGTGDFYLNPNVEKQHQTTVEYEKKIDEKKLNTTIRNALNSLATRQRECFILLLEGLSQAEIARRLNVSESTVSRDINVGKLRLAKFLTRDEERFLTQYYNDYLKK